MNNGYKQDRAPDQTATRDMRFPSSSGASIIPRNTGVGPQLPPRDDAPSDAAFVRLQYPPRMEKIPGSIDFNAQTYNLVLPLPAGSVVAGASFRVPKDQIGWLQNAFLWVLTPTAATLVELSIRINGGPVSGFDNIQAPPGIANFIQLPLDEMRVGLPNGCLVETFLTNRGTTAEVVGAGISGWYHPESSEQSAWGQGR